MDRRVFAWMIVIVLAVAPFVALFLWVVSQALPHLPAVPK